MEIALFESVQKGLKALGDSACSIKQNLEQRIQNPFAIISVQDSVVPISDIRYSSRKIWNAGLYSKTFVLCGSKNEDDRRRIKIDHDFDLTQIINGNISPNGSIPTSQEAYLESQGTEFILMMETEVEGGVNPFQEAYAIRADKYDKVREGLNQGKYPKASLEEAGGFKIWQCLTPEEVIRSDGWLELAVGKNRASEEEYAEASALLAQYVTLAKKNGCFRNTQHRAPGLIYGAKDVQWGMQLGIHSHHNNYEIHPLYLGNVHQRSEVSGFHFGMHACFVRIANH